MNNEARNYQDIEERTLKFPIRIIKMVNQLPKCSATYVINNQIIGSVTSTHSNIIHAKSGLTKNEFTYFLNNAKKEAKETKGWLQIIIGAELAKPEKMQLLLKECDEIICILVKSVKTAQNK